MEAHSNRTVIREATPADAALIVEFNVALALESEDKHLDRNLLAPGVDLALRRRDMCRYFIAESGGKVVGQTMITYELTDWRNGVLWWIQSVYVVPEARRLGIFRSLYEHIEGTARKDPEVRGLRLYVEEKNVKALRVYEALGMHASGYRVYEKEWS